MNTRFLIAVRRGDVDSVKRILKEDDHIYGSLDFALRQAAQYGHACVVPPLLEAGADVNSTQGDALSWSASGGFVEVMRLILDAGPDVQYRNEALNCAAENKHADAVRLLLNHGATVTSEQMAALSPDMQSVIQSARRARTIKSAAKRR